MSRFRGQNSRSPYRTPPRLYETQRDAFVQEQIRLKSALRAEADNRRIHDEIAILQTKVRHTTEIQERCQTLMRQNNQLARDNDQLSRLLNEKKYQIQRIRAVSTDQNERQAIKNGQLYQMNKSLQLEIQLLKKERIQSNRLYESHIDKLERMLDQKVSQVDSMTLRCSDLSKQLQIAGIRFEQQKNRLKNLMNRTEHELQRELQYTKQKTTSQKFSQIDGMKRNHAAQIAILEDEISKLKILNSAKTDDFENQLAENKVLRRRHQQEMRSLANENDELRDRLLKLEELNRSEVENIKTKYNDYHNQGTSSLKQQYSKEINLLLDQIDRQKWLISIKNNQNQIQAQQKKAQKKLLQEIQLQLSSEISNLKNRLNQQQIKFNQQNHSHMERINFLSDQLNRQSEGYHSRALDFQKKIINLQSQINDKQNIIEKIKTEASIKQKQLQRTLNEANSAIQKIKRQLADSQQERKGENARNEQFIKKNQENISQLSKKLNETEVKLQEANDRIERLTQSSSGAEDLLKIEINSLRQNVSILEEKLSTEQHNHSNQMKELSSNINEKLDSLKRAQRKALDELEQSKKQQCATLNQRLDKSTRDRKQAEEQLNRYIEMYNNMQKYFKDPHDGALFEQRSQNSIYQVLSKVSKSSINIF